MGVSAYRSCALAEVQLYFVNLHVHTCIPGFSSNMPLVVAITRVERVTKSAIPPLLKDNQEGEKSINIFDLKHCIMNASSCASYMSLNADKYNLMELTTRSTSFTRSQQFVRYAHAPGFLMFLLLRVL